MNNFELSGKSLTVSFVRKRNIFSNVDFSVKNSEIVGVAGPNGSGKTTLLKVLSGLLRPKSGEVVFTLENTILKNEEIAAHIGYVSPYLILYEEFTALEHLELFAKLRGTSFDRNLSLERLKQFGLNKRSNDLIKTFSSGMKQKVKYLLAVQKNPEILFLDEPFTNLDASGIDAVKEVIQEHTDASGGIVIASNDEREKELCSRIVYLDN